MQTHIIIGVIASLLVQFLRWFGLPALQEGHVKTIRAGIVLLGVTIAVAEAATRPGGLVGLDWNHILTTAWDALLIIFGAFATHATIFRTSASKS